MKRNQFNKGLIDKERKKERKKEKKKKRKELKEKKKLREIMKGRKEEGIKVTSENRNCNREIRANHVIQTHEKGEK